MNPHAWLIVYSLVGVVVWICAAALLAAWVLEQIARFLCDEE